MGKRKIGEIYNKPIVEGDINLKTPNEIHKSELSGGGANSEITLNDISNIHPYELIIKEYPYPCTKDPFRWDGFHPTRIETITADMHVISAEYMYNEEFYFNKNGYDYREDDCLSVSKILIDTVEVLEGTVEMYVCIVLNLSFILFYGSEKDTNIIIDELIREGGF